jgi:hypothetical protein
MAGAAAPGVGFNAIATEASSLSSIVSSWGPIEARNVTGFLSPEARFERPSRPANRAMTALKRTSRSPDGFRSGLYRLVDKTLATMPKTIYLSIER